MIAGVIDAPVKADTNDRKTPRWFFEQCAARFGHFDFDVAATSDNNLATLLRPAGGDMLDQNWTWGTFFFESKDKRPIQAWCNPPYGPAGAIPKWITKAREQRDQFGTRTLLLLPADTSTKWYHDVARSELVELVPFRLAFEAPDGSTKGNSAKFGSVLVWIAPKIHAPARRKGR